jgi:hypothetical protein
LFVNIKQQYSNSISEYIEMEPKKYGESDISDPREALIELEKPEDSEIPVMIETSELPEAFETYETPREIEISETHETTEVSEAPVTVETFERPEEFESHEILEEQELSAIRDTSETQEKKEKPAHKFFMKNKGRSKKQR